LDLVDDAFGTATAGAAVTSPPNPIEFQTVRKGYDPTQVDTHVADLEAQLADSAHRNETLDRQLRETSEEAAQLLLSLESERDRTATVEQQLDEALQREESVRLMLQEATKTRDRIRAEAEATLKQARAQASREDRNIVKQAMDKASSIVAEAKKDRSQLLASGRAELAALERDATQRIADLEADHAELTQRNNEIDSVYNELVQTLESFLETSLQSMHKAQDPATGPAETAIAPSEPPYRDRHANQARETA
jgi:cell division septum initiation protein DivIVA